MSGLRQDQIKDFSGLIVKCVDCWKRGILTPIYNENSRTRQTIYCSNCKKRRTYESIKRSKDRLRMGGL